MATSWPEAVSILMGAGFTGSFNDVVGQPSGVTGSGNFGSDPEFIAEVTQQLWQDEQTDFLSTSHRSGYT